MAKTKADTAPKAVKEAETDEQVLEQVAPITTKSGDATTDVESTDSTLETTEEVQVEDVAKKPTSTIEEKQPLLPTKEATVQQPKQKLVRVHLTEDLDSTVGRVNYTGRKNSEIDVPSDVAAIIVNGKFGYRV